MAEPPGRQANTLEDGWALARTRIFGRVKASLPPPLAIYAFTTLFLSFATFIMAVVGVDFGTLHSKVKNSLRLLPNPILTTCL